MIATTMDLVVIEKLQHIRGIPFPEEYDFRQFIVTGPAGCGKSTLVTKIGGWPEEGYVDLAARGWWKAPSLTFRPREVHLGIPCVGFRKSLAVFEKEWLECVPAPEIDYARIQVLPTSKGWLRRDWRAAYVFEFLLPAPETILAWRLQRQSRGTHHVDRTLVLDEIIRQRQAYHDIAEFFHRCGLQVYIRLGLGEPPHRFSTDDAA